MCYALFIGADEPLRVEGPVEADGRFHLEEPQPHHSVILGIFSKPHVFYAASWQGCGCGWFPDTLALQGKQARLESNRKTALCVRQFGELLSQLLESHESVELLLTWEPELEHDSTHTMPLSPGDFRGAALPMEQGEFAVVTRGPLS